MIDVGFIYALRDTPVWFVVAVFAFVVLRQIIDKYYKTK